MLNVKAETQMLDTVQDFIHESLEKAGIDADIKALTQLDVAVEEVFVNIANYAYAPNTGDAIIEAQVSDGSVLTVSFIDSGKAFDPLAAEDPDVTLSADERGIGGLGIFLTKKFMDKVEYQRKDDKNILTLTKKF
ncbi:Anti-sigma regulatory factor (Ser/Thr protein kinase) [Treponema sp. JC4]|uniref:ATP-binding protein n=1 Tax=Treponema sp. JC4 TaxID=1124982 RepID=UPI00025B0DF2|nr:ATP-binding protein [Treponema sp. JC4]EID85190.1 Anti-sigma regulatory factor (Ser/Thr protein kinase) [Treponema sp. JC4]